MSDDRDRDEAAPTLTPDRARQLILARRARFMAAALAGMASASCAEGGDGPGICLTLQPDDSRPDAEAGANICLTVDAQVRDGGMDSGPRVCLSLPLTCDGSTPRRSDCPIEDAGEPTDARSRDATVPVEGGVKPFDAGRFDGGPQVSLSPPRRSRDALEDEEVST